MGAASAVEDLRAVARHLADFRYGARHGFQIHLPLGISVQKRNPGRQREDEFEQRPCPWPLLHGGRGTGPPAVHKRCQAAWRRVCRHALRLARTPCAIAVGGMALRTVAFGSIQCSAKPRSCWTSGRSPRLRPRGLKTRMSRSRRACRMNKGSRSRPLAVRSRTEWASNTLSPKSPP